MDIETKRYYSIYDKVANDFCDLWSAKNDAAALRSFYHSLSNQKSKGIITSEDDYQLFHVVDLLIDEEGGMMVKDVCVEVVDSEKNNKESE